MASKPSEDTLKPWKAGDPWGSVTVLPGAYPPSPETQEANYSVAPQSLSAAVKARKDEYIRKKSMRIKVGTWNVAAINGTEKDLGAWFVGGKGVKGLSQYLSGRTTEDGEGDDDTDDDDSDRNFESVEAQEARVASTKKTATVPLGDGPAEPHDEQIDLYVLGLQEVIDVTSMTEAIRPYTDPNPAKKWKKSLRRALPKGYKKVAEEQLLGLLILIFASPELSPDISSVSTTSVGTGLFGYLGNKGAVCVRALIGDTTKLCFVNCHLAAGADQAALTRRIWDTEQILSKTRFSPVTDSEAVESGEERIGDEDFAFWFGDLNYRLDDIPGQDVRRLLLLHTQNEYDLENKSKRKIDSELGYVVPDSSDSLPSHPAHYEYQDRERPATESTAEPPLDPKNDPASLQTTLQSLLVHDQLRAQQRLGKAFHEGWREGDIDFLPTYKYDVGSVGMFDSGEKKRSPSWCDRILYRTRRDLEIYNDKAKQREEARKKDEAMKARGMDEATAEHAVLFDYDPDTDGLAYGDDYDEFGAETPDVLHDAELVQSHDDYGDMIELTDYLSHQRVLSSDHKPLNAVFTLIYDAVIPELKSKVQQEVAKLLDKAENEGRPSITLVVDHHLSDDERESSANADGAVEDVNVVRFGDVRYGVKKTRAVTIANTGQIAATFSFVERPTIESDEGASIVPKWLDLSLESGSVYSSAQQAEHKGTYELILAPGETTVIDLTVEVTDPNLVHALNNGDMDLEDVLVLRVQDGRDHFIPVKGHWLPSSFHRTLDELVLASEGGVRQWSASASAKARASKVTSNTSDWNVHHSAPKELYALTEIIPVYIERSIAEWGMLRDGDLPPWQYEQGGPSWPFNRDTWTFHAGEERSEMLAGVREALDTAQTRLDANFDATVPTIVRLEVLAETLTAFLASLRDGIVPSDTWSEVDKRLNALDKEKEAVKGSTTTSAQEIQDLTMDALSSHPVHSVSLTFITFLLTRLVNEMMTNGFSAASSTSTAATTRPATPSQPASQKSSRRSRASTLSSDSGKATLTPTPSISSHDTATTTTSSTTTIASTSRRSSLFPVSVPAALRRIRTRSNSSASASASACASAADLAAQAAAQVSAERRKTLVTAYVEVFAPLVVRMESVAKGKEKKALEARRRRVLEAFLA